MSTVHSEQVGSTGIELSKPKWGIVEGDRYSADQVIHAFRSGQEKGINDFIAATQKVAEINLKSYMEVIDDFIDILKKDFKIDFVDARIKVQSHNEFESIIVLGRDTYFSEKMDEIYARLYEHEETVDIDFDQQIMFTYDGENINYEKMILDGYRYYRKPS
ncbi:MAG: hypothetical protein WD317_11420 [Balneolaceae bacterium]